MSILFEKVNKNEEYLEKQRLRESNARSYPRRIPIAIKKAVGTLITDMNDKTYYDCLAGAGTLALGHNHPEIIRSMKEVFDNQVPLHTLDITTTVKDEFIQEIFECLPREFAQKAKIHFCGPTGGDAVEAALKLVKTATGRRSILSFHGGYHGSTHGSLSVSGTLGPKEHIVNLMPEVHFLPYPYEYRCPFGIGENGHKIGSQYIENLLDDPESGIVHPAGVIMEVVQGEGGSIPAPVEWIREIRRITKERNIPLIIDEVQTGIGRTGKMFAFEHADIIPDVVILSKAIGGSLPLSVIIYNEELDTWKPGAHIGTFRGNQLAMAAGIATLQHIKKNNILEHVEKVGSILINQLKDIKLNEKCIGDVRGKGLMVGVEIIDSNKSPNKLGTYPAHTTLARRIQEECIKKGLIVEVGGRHSSVIRFLPPLIITEEQVNNVCKIFSESISEAKKF
ncbi:diaminobutyrate--2-oxoglutarate transaminase [Bacillus cereus]